eukprot:CAMPEP_0119014098 /NCGR_PEP_ID=MMETSP1176-20130426/9352_1 /TAXON_ID=265551 /ORGANISM="Synedropsis recta cf, Strain CCMP1620" /LENGTH=220 /DNA_ID=CAMNT_0006967237 /DNA_START=22 /DNA_END=684 /DNA_ORIENTATION=+
MRLFAPPATTAVLLLLSSAFHVDSWSPSIARNNAGAGLLQRRSLLQQLSVGVLLQTGGSSAEAAADNGSPKKLTFQTLTDGVQLADIIEGTKSTETVQTDSKVTFHVLGRLLGKQGWVFMNTAEKDDDPYRFQMGSGIMIQGLEEGMVGMKVGGKRRIVIPSAVGYANKSLEPIPRDFGYRQRLYTTVMNSVRMDREREALGADLAGVVVMDVELVRLRK